MEPRTRIAGLVLAAGSGSRMGTPKAELVLDGVRLLDRAVSVLIGAGCDPVVAVVREGTAAPGADEVVNPAPERGMGSSLELGIASVARGSGAIDAIAVMLVDLPGLTIEGSRRVVEGWRPGRVAVGSVGGRRTHPTVMSPELWRDAVALAGPDEGARRFLTSHPELIDEIEVDGDPRDLDTPADLATWVADSDLS